MQTSVIKVFSLWAVDCPLVLGHKKSISYVDIIGKLFIRIILPGNPWSGQGLMYWASPSLSMIIIIAAVINADS
jgi:hypothetical protein